MPDVRARDVYTQHTQEEVQKVIKDYGYRAVAFRPPQEGEEWLNRWGAIANSVEFLKPNTSGGISHRLILKRERT